MALYFVNSSGVDAFISFMWPISSCGPFLQFRKQAWWRVNNGQSYNLWNIDLRTAYAPTGSSPFGAFYAEQFRNGGGNTWGGASGTPNAIISDVGPMNQCFDNPTGCNQTVEMAVLPFNTAPNMTVQLLAKVPEEPNWTVIVFD